MVAFEINESIARKIREIADRESRSVDEVLANMLANYVIEEQQPESETSGLEIFLDLFPDSDVTDASTTVRESMARHYRSKHESTD
jgi:hypothetical protein